VQLTFSDNMDMMGFKNGTEWPAERQQDLDLRDRWLHGDFRGVAYFFNFKLYDDICSPNRGGFQ